MALPHPHLPPLWREGRIGLEWAGLRRSEVFRGVGVPQGGGRGVLLIPGFLAGDGSLGTMTQWLRAAGYRTKSAGIRSNIACSEVACMRLETRLECLSARTGRRVVIVGQSRGGVLAKSIGARRPDLVAGVVTLGAPVVSQLSVHPIVLAQVGMLAALGSGPVPGLISWSCLRGTCCERFRESVAGPLPPDVGYVALYSRSDGIVDWRSCIDPHADACVEVHASHCGMGMNAHAYRAIARALRGFGAGDEGWAEAA
ncbi:MAG TPA: alpha/beta hydrolase [Solirubrobacteraceae bacterium]|nr:alpha/beta hydrolase [Solirubrobacteraceae bacterium]